MSPSRRCRRGSRSWRRSWAPPWSTATAPASSSPPPGPTPWRAPGPSSPRPRTWCAGPATAGQPLAGRFRLGVIPTIAPFLLPAALPVLRERFPKLKLFLREDLTHRLIADLKAGVLDAALIALPYDMTGLDWVHVGDDELVAAFPAGHPLCAAARIAPERMDGEDLILLEDGHCLRDHVMAACGLGARQHGARRASRPAPWPPWCRWSAPGWASPSCPPWPWRRDLRGRPRSPSAPSTPTMPAARSSSPGAPARPARRRGGFWRRSSPPVEPARVNPSACGSGR